MDIEYVLGMVLSLVLIGYLVFALLRPERF
ncbi:MAG TPA: K(+)-transporting ATPase subunit F [Pirellulales bacterium]|nr:K(+)-transporting ATPase subunit F [Pirellulales bacterium]